MNSNRPNSPVRSKAFTLIELLTVIAIIGILAAIIIPTVGAVRKSAASAKALSNVKQLGMANLLYSQDYKSQLLGWGADGSEPVANAVLRNFAIYAMQQKFKNQNYQFTDRLLMDSLANFVDPRVPEAFQKYNTVPWTWAFNRIVNTSYGRTSELAQLGLPTAGMVNGPRRFAEFENPSKTLYLLSGAYEIQTTAFDIAPLADPDNITTRNTHPIFYYHRSNTGTPAVFLDGHSAILTYPIPKNLLNPRLP
ncbi:MAG: hypothetical protein RIQ79_227 [Verrucomicrobiota bacterium]